MNKTMKKIVTAAVVCGTGLMLLTGCGGGKNFLNIATCLLYTSDAADDLLTV